MTAYERGFIDKCAELGVDPIALLKAADVFSPMERFMDAHPNITRALTGRTLAESRGAAQQARTMRAARSMQGRDRRPTPTPVQAVAPAMGKTATTVR